MYRRLPAFPPWPVRLYKIEAKQMVTGQGRLALPSDFLSDVGCVLISR
jgi:hypothetical protein